MPWAGSTSTIPKALDDPTYHGYGVKMGWSVTAGPHHFNGSDALAYARIRHPAGESDFTRQLRQQALLIALRRQLASPDLVLRLPALISTVGADVETDMPRDQLPTLAAVASEIGTKSIYQLVVRYPMVHPASISPYGSVQVPDLVKIRAAAAALFTGARREALAQRRLPERIARRLIAGRVAEQRAVARRLGPAASFVGASFGSGSCRILAPVLLGEDRATPVAFDEMTSA